MRAYITTCCAQKLTEEREIPAIDRYLDERIRMVYKQSLHDECAFFILSGKYGLLHPEDRIPWYDYPLSSEHVKELSEKVQQQMQTAQLSGITLFVRREWQPYIDVLTISAEKAKIPLHISFL